MPQTNRDNWSCCQSKKRLPKRGRAWRPCETAECVCSVHTTAAAAARYREVSLPVSPVLGQPAGHAVFRVGADDACSGDARFGHGVGHGAALRGDAEHRHVIDVVPKADDAPRARHLHHAGQCAGLGAAFRIDFQQAACRIRRNNSSR